MGSDQPTGSQLRNRKSMCSRQRACRKGVVGFGEESAIKTGLFHVEQCGQSGPLSIWQGDDDSKPPPCATRTALLLALRAVGSPSSLDLCAPMPSSAAGAMDSADRGFAARVDEHSK